MDLNERFNILAQGVTAAQKAGVLTLEQAVTAKTSIDKIQKGEEIKQNLVSLVTVCEAAQKAGVFTLADAHLVFMASENIEQETDKFIAESQQKQENGVQELVPEDSWESEAPAEAPKKSGGKKKGK